MKRTIQGLTNTEAQLIQQAVARKYHEVKNMGVQAEEVGRLKLLENSL